MVIGDKIKTAIRACGIIIEKAVLLFLAKFL